MSTYEKKGKKIDPEGSNDIVDTAGYMDIPMDDIGDNYDDNYQDDDWEPDIKLKVITSNYLYLYKVQISSDDRGPVSDQTFVQPAFMI